MLPDVILCNQYTLVTVSLEQEINIYIFRDELITTEYRSAMLYSVLRPSIEESEI